MLGELYKPKGLALETAQAVLETENAYAVNVAVGCTNKCLYCYVPKFLRKSTDKCCLIRLPKNNPADLVKCQLDKGLKPDGVFLSFLTDPLLPENRQATYEVSMALWQAQVKKIAVLSKINTTERAFIRHGMTIVSLDNKFHKSFEPNTTSPLQRLKMLELWKAAFNSYVWVSMEPYPPSEIYKQNFETLLEQLSFVDFIVFGMWNYDARARTEKAKQEYAENIAVLQDFCKQNTIRFHVKSDTLKASQSL